MLGKKKKEIIQLTVPVHANFEAFFQPTGLALVSPGDIDRAGVVLLALVSQISSNAALEKSSAAIARKHAVVLPRSSVTAYFAQNCLLGF